MPDGRQTHGQVKRNDVHIMIYRNHAYAIIDADSSFKPETYIPANDCTCKCY